MKNDALDDLAAPDMEVVIFIVLLGTSKVKANDQKSRCSWPENFVKRKKESAYGHLKVLIFAEQSAPVRFFLS